MANSANPNQGWAPPRTNLFDCSNVHDGSIDFDKYMDYVAGVVSRQRWMIETISELISCDNVPPPLDHRLPNPPHEKQKRGRRLVWAHQSSKDGLLELITPRESVWYAMFLTCTLLRMKSCQQNFVIDFACLTQLSRAR